MSYNVRFGDVDLTRSAEVSGYYTGVTQPHLRSIKTKKNDNGHLNPIAV